MYARFSCRQCGVKEVLVNVPVRILCEDIMKYLERVSLNIKDAHTRVSPLCESDKFDILLPVGGYVGDDTGHIPPRGLM